MIPVEISAVRHIHLVAVCGVGMGTLAGMLKEKGYRVTGSDQAIYPPMSEKLAAWGIPVLEGYKPEHLEPRPDLVVIGNAISKGNPEGDAVLARDIPYLSMAEALRLFFFDGKILSAICGTHGKTTSTALLSWVLENAGLDPTYLVGGVLENTGRGYRVGRGSLAVVEGDEYDTAWFDKVPKFVRYRPDLAVLGNIEFDHADIYADLAAVIDAFRQLVVNLPPDGLLVAGIDNPRVRDLLPLAPCATRTFGFRHGADLTGKILDMQPDGMSFEVFTDGKSRGIYRSPIVGEYNLLNILGVIGLTERLGLGDEALRAGLASFTGVKRRQQVLGEAAGVLVIDDFAHHPTAVRVTLESLRAIRPKRRLVTIFEPRTNTSRRAFFQQEYAAAFGAADAVILCEVQALTKGIPGDKLDVERLVADLRIQGKEAWRAPDYPAVLEMLQKCLSPGDQAVFLSNGGFGDLPRKTLAFLQEKDARA